MVLFFNTHTKAGALARVNETSKLGLLSFSILPLLSDTAMKLPT